MLLDRDFEHLAGAGTVDVPSVPESFNAPFPAGQAGENSCHDEFAIGFGNERNTDQLAEDLGNIGVAHPLFFLLFCFI